MSNRLDELRRQHAERTRQLGGQAPGTACTPPPARATAGNAAPPAVRAPTTPTRVRRVPVWVWMVAGGVLGGGGILALLLALAFGYAAGTGAAGRPEPGAGDPAQAPGSSPPDGAMGMGTGWVCESGLVVTNHHVVAGGSDFVIAFSRERAVPATLVASDAANDLALLRVDDSPVPAGLPFAGQPAVLGQRVFTIGFPHADILGIEPKVTDGTVSSVTGMQDDPRTLQVSVPVQPGNSGGPLLNLRGEVVGVVTSKLNAIEVFRYTGDVPQNVNFAVKAEYVRSLLVATGLMRHASVVPAAEDDLQEVVRRVRGSVVIVLVRTR